MILTPDETLAAAGIAFIGGAYLADWAAPRLIRRRKPPARIARPTHPPASHVHIMDDHSREPYDWASE